MHLYFLHTQKWISTISGIWPCLYSAVFTLFRVGHRRISELGLAWAWLFSAQNFRGSFGEGERKKKQAKGTRKRGNEASDRPTTSQNGTPGACKKGRSANPGESAAETRAAANRGRHPSNTRPLSWVGKGKGGDNRALFAFRIRSKSNG